MPPRWPPAGWPRSKRPARSLRLQAAASAYFDKAKPTAVVSSAMQFSPNAGLTEFTVTATSWIRTPFLGVIHAWTQKEGSEAAPIGCKGNYFGCIGLTTTATAALCPSAACIGSSSGGSNIEVSLMLDVTGSMCDPCTKITAAKTAAKDLIDIVVWDDQSQYTSKVAIAPFAEAVNVGTTLAPLVRGTVTANTRGDPAGLEHRQHDQSVDPADEPVDQVPESERQQLQQQQYLHLADLLEVRDRADRRRGLYRMRRQR